MDAAPSRSLFRYFLPADAFVRILVHGPRSATLRARPGLNRVAYRRLVIEACCPEYSGDLAGALAESFPHDPLAAEDLLYQLCVEVNPQLDIHSVSLAPAGDRPERRAARAVESVGGDSQRLARRARGLAERLGRRVLGQAEVIEAVSAHARRVCAGLAAPRRPLGAFLFLGRTGTGKTELARALAGELFADEGGSAGLVRVDCGEYALGHEYAKLIGAPPGYVGHDQGGFLTDAVRKRPDCVVLFDEIEKAHGRVHHLLLSLLDEGRLCDGRGQSVDFTRALVILTSNAGAGELQRAARGVGFAHPAPLAADTAASIAQGALESTFSPEFLARLDGRLLFRELDLEDAVAIARLQLSELALRARRRGTPVAFSDAVARWVAERGWNPDSGARELRRVIERDVEGPLAERLLDDGRCSQRLLRAGIRRGALVLRRAA